MVGHAVVLGGGIAGLAAVAALADGTRAVTLVERDRYPERPGPRAGAPQSRHVHTLLMRGSAELEELLPGAGATLVDRGALRLDWGMQRLLGAYGWSPRLVTGLIGTFCSRDLVEQLLREAVLCRPGVSLLDKHEVVGLLGDSDRVRGAWVRPRGPAPKVADQAYDGAPAGVDRRPQGLAGAHAVEADLVVDATGRGSASPQWLATLGVPPLRELVVSSGLGYASRTYRRTEGLEADWGLLLVRRPPPSSGTGVLYPIEGGRWVVTLSGTGAEVPPHDEVGFAAFAAELPGGVGAALSGAVPLGHVASYRSTASRWRRWDRSRSLPSGLLAVGDAVCCFNPVYGQGMTVALAQARLLRDAARTGALDEGRLAFVQRTISSVVADPWALTTQEDFRYPTTQGRRPVAAGLTHRYADRVLAATARDPVVFRRFLQVTHLLRPQRSLAEPAIVRRVLLRTPVGQGGCAGGSQYAARGEQGRTSRTGRYADP